MKQLLVLLTLLTMATGATARSIADLFVLENAPAIGNTLSPTQRLDMLDYLRNDQDAVVTNEWSDESSLDSLTERYLLLTASEVKTVEMQLLTQGRDTVVAVIETYALPAKDSRISFYNQAWTPLRTSQFFKMPTTQDFALPTATDEQLRALQEQLRFDVISLHFEGERLVARHSLREYLTAEEWKKVQPCLRDSISYVIKGTKIKREK